MYKILLTISFFLISNLAYAENKELKELSNEAEKQEAGKLVNTEEIFKKLTEKCDETDVLVLRARIRLELPRIDKNTASEVEKMMMKGLELCSEKKIDEAEQEEKIKKSNIPEKYWFEEDPAKSYLLNVNIKSYSTKNYKQVYKIY